jgi:putative ABC transport system permease protein
MNTVIEIGWLQLGLCLLFILAAGAASIALRLGLQRDLLWGTVRTFAQLFMLGLVLKYVFNIRLWWPVLLIFWCMLAFAVQIIHGRVKEKSVRYLDTTFLSMFLSFTLITMIINGIIVQVRPWYEPRYFLPLGGMVIGNSMNAIAIALERLLGELRKSTNLVEMRLTLGATYREAAADITRGAVRAGMIPSINAMMGVGMVFIPGMMTGQILAGADVITAVKYQIMVMLMLVGSTSVGSVLVVLLSLRRCFTRDGRLRL